MTVPRPTPLPPAPSVDFVLSSFNVLGASHTTADGNKPQMASGRVRAVRAARLIRRYDAEVIGFQELQGSQLATLQRSTDLDFYPGFSMRSQDSENSLGWRRSRWVAVERHVVRIPYFNGGLRAMPYVRLRHRSTGVEAWFANFHNPADTARFPRQERFRLRATRIQIDLTNRLITRTGLPVFVTGDMNERSSYFCRFTAATPMVAARGGSNNGRCQAGRPRSVDWIFGSQGVAFTGYYEDRSRLVDVTTDHPLIVARVHVTGKRPGD
ncbi:MAG TPA: endonuclease/exonuclease/phosphatase family protein [Nocardioidaceae bacterium]|nr:endonuclease/exonuclease/phosphatase family protein [Nocardioidaceae bacterium]